MDKIKQGFNSIKVYIVELPKKKKVIFGGVAAGVILFAVLLTVFLNSANGRYAVLYENLESTESAQVFSELKSMGADAQLSSSGQVMVPQDEFDIWLLQLAAQGYPKSAPTYDIFESNTSMSATEAEMQQVLVHQLQDRAQVTLERIDGVLEAIVTINMAESSDYIWDEATNDAVGSTSVLLTLSDGVVLDSTQVLAIKNLIAFGVPKMAPENVVVVDASTSLELGAEDSLENTVSVNENFELESIVQSQLEESIVRLLAPRYGDDGVVASAKVTINYDKMITEQMELLENEDGEGFPTHTDGEYNGPGDETIEDIVGEEDNTDIPDYSYTNPDDETSYYAWNTDIDYSYIKTQVESGNAELERATISVMVDEENMTQERRDELTSLISTGVDIPAEQIYVSSFVATGEVIDEPTINPEPEINQWWTIIPWWGYLAAGGLLFIIIILFIIISFRRYHNAKAVEITNILEDEKNAEIEEYKKKLADMAKSEDQEKNAAIIEEVRAFAQVNPEAAASLLRSWLKEE